MLKPILTLAVFAALAGPASAADSVKVSLVGKTPTAIRAEIARAARTVCIDAYGGSQFAFFVMAGCVRDTIRQSEQSAGLLAVKSDGPRLASAR